MAGVNDNLKPKPFTSETAREADRKGGIASGISKRRKANLFYTTRILSPCQRPTPSVIQSSVYQVLEYVFLINIYYNVYQTIT